MAKLVFFLFFAACVAAVQMTPVPESEDSLPNIDEVLDIQGRVNSQWKKAWESAKPIIKEAGKAAGKEIIKGIEDKIKNH